MCRLQALTPRLLRPALVKQGHITAVKGFDETRTQNADNKK